jgi:hypothetical protein
MRFIVEPAADGGPAVWNDTSALDDLDQLLQRAEEAWHVIDLRDADLLDDSA